MRPPAVVCPIGLKLTKSVHYSAAFFFTCRLELRAIERVQLSVLTFVLHVMLLLYSYHIQYSFPMAVR